MNIEFTQLLYFIIICLYIYLMIRWCFIGENLKDRVQRDGIKAIRKPLLLTLVLIAAIMFPPINTTQPRNQGVSFNTEFNNGELQKSERVMYGDTIKQRLEEGVTAEEILNETEEENPNE